MNTYCCQFLTYTWVLGSIAVCEAVLQVQEFPSRLYDLYNGNHVPWNSVYLLKENNKFRSAIHHSQLNQHVSSWCVSLTIFARNSNSMKTPVLAIRSQQIFAHATTAKLSWHVQNLVAITVLASRWELNSIYIKLELRWKNCSWNGALAGEINE